jgi:hypothetical protein
MSDHRPRCNKSDRLPSEDQILQRIATLNQEVKNLFTLLRVVRRVRKNNSRKGDPDAR